MAINRIKYQESKDINLLTEKLSTIEITEENEAEIIVWINSWRREIERELNTIRDNQNYFSLSGCFTEEEISFLCRYIRGSLVVFSFGVRLFVREPYDFVKIHIRYFSRGGFVFIDQREVIVYLLTIAFVIARFFGCLCGKMRDIVFEIAFQNGVVYGISVVGMINVLRRSRNVF